MSEKRLREEASFRNGAIWFCVFALLAVLLGPTLIPIFNDWMERIVNAMTGR